MTLCGVRPEGFGPSSALSFPFPTTCFTDTILIPLPTWLFLASLPPLLLLTQRSLSPAHPAHTPKRSWTFTIAQITYYFFILVNILMLTLELVRLVMINFSVGLLPFEYVGLLGGAYLHFSKGFGGKIGGWGWVWVNCVLLWGGGVVVNVVKVVGLVREGGVREGKYPMVDQITDVAVVAGVYGIIAAVEVLVWFLEGKRADEAREGKGSLRSLYSREGEEMEVGIAR